MGKNDQLAKIDSFAALVPASEAAASFDRSEVMSENLGAGGLNPSDLDRVKIPAGGGTAWEIPTLDGRGDVAKELNVIIVAARDVRSYYSEKYNGDKNPPDCVSLDCVNGVGDPGGLCASCPMAQWGSAVDQTGNPTAGQACAQRKMMLCITENSTLPFVISAPPSSLKNLKKYFMRLAGAGLPYFGVVTKLTLERTASGSGIDHSVIVPEYIRTLTEEEIPAIKSYRSGLLPMFNMVTARNDD
jgi:hypothetical protein